MDKVFLKATQSDCFYNGRFAPLGFELLAGPIPVYRNLLMYLGKYGATLNSLRFEGTVLSDANINCFLNPFNTFIRVRIDRLEVNFLKLHEIGDEVAHQILLGTWEAISKVEPSIQVSEHVISLNVFSQLKDISYEALIGRYVKIPPGCGKKTRAGVGFYFPKEEEVGINQASFIVDAVVGRENDVLLRIDLTFDAKKVPFDGLRKCVDDYLERHLGLLGLAFLHEAEASN